MLLCCGFDGEVRFDESKGPPQIACSRDADCPDTWVCAEVLERCVPTARIDDVPPALVGEPQVSPSVIGRGQVCTISFEVSEPLGRDPEVSLDAGGYQPRDFSLAEQSTDRGALRYTYSYTADGSETPGERQISINLIDAYGLPALDQRGGSVVLDFQAPTVVPAAVQPGFASAGTTISIELNFDEPLAAAPTVVMHPVADPSQAFEWLEVGGASGGGYSYQYTAQGTEPEGAYNIDVSAQDPFGNRVNVGQLVGPVLDFTAPTLVDVVVNPTLARPGVTALLTVNVDETLAQPPLLVWLDDLDPGFTASPPTPPSYQFNLVVGAEAEEGAFQLSAVTCTDLAGNSASLPVQGLGFSIDRSLPEVSAIHLNAQRFSLQPGYDEVVLQLDVSEAPGPDASAIVATLQGAPMSCGSYDPGAIYDYTCSYSIDGSELEPGRGEGPALIEIQVTDAAGNPGFGSALVQIDFEPPHLGGVSFSPSVVSPGRTVEARLRVGEALGAVPVLQWRDNPDAGAPLFEPVGLLGDDFLMSATISAASTETTFHLDGVQLVDSVGNHVSASTEADFRVSDEPPLVTNVSLAATRFSAQVGHDLIQIEFEVEQEVLPPRVFMQAFQLLCNTSAAPRYSCSHTVTGVEPEGFLPIDIEVEDINGITAFASAVVELDFSPPELRTAELTPTTAGLGDAVTLALAADEALGSTPVPVLSGPGLIDLQLISGSSYTYQHRITAQDADGEYRASVQLVDQVANASVMLSLGSLWVDSSPPLISNVATGASHYSPQAGDNQVLVRFDVDESLDDGSANLMVLFDGVAMSCSAYQTTSPSYTCTLVLPATYPLGTALIEIRAKDAAGNAASDSVEVEIWLCPSGQHDGGDGVTCVADSLCLAGYFGPDCSGLCPGGPASPCNGMGVCDDGPEGDGSCLCQEGIHAIGGSCAYPLEFDEIGAGIAGDPYLIYTAEQLDDLGQTGCSGVSSGSCGAQFSLMADIDLSASSGTTFHSIGHCAAGPPCLGNPFNGVFEGNDHSIFNLSLDQPGQNHVALFRAAGNMAALRNIHIKNVRVSGGDFVGGLVGESRGRVEGCSVTGRVSGQRSVGGLVGFADLGSTLIDVAAEVEVEGLAGVGGLAGESMATVDSASASGPVTAAASEVGGLIGLAGAGSVSDSVASGQVNGVANVGGLIGLSSASVARCQGRGRVYAEAHGGGLIGDSRGAVQASSGRGAVSVVTGPAGGLLGASSAPVSDSWASGAVVGDHEVGGLIGLLSTGLVSRSFATGVVQALVRQAGGLVGRSVSGTIADCLATGAVSAALSAGGLLGSHGGDARASYASGPVSGLGTGGLAGELSGGSFADSYWNGDTSGQGLAVGGTPSVTGTFELGSADMQRATAFNFDFDLVWKMPPGGGPPVLQWQVEPPFAAACWAGFHIYESRYDLAGAGTAGNPYLICTAAQLDDIGASGCNASVAVACDDHFRLLGDVDLGHLGSTSFDRIGYCEPGSSPCQGAPFKGSFDGGGHTLWNFEHVDLTAEAVGLFAGTSSDASIFDLRLANARVSGGSDVGPLVGVHSGMVRRCEASGVASGDTRIGGLIGSSDQGAIEQCAARTSVRSLTTEGSDVGEIGGLVGSMLGGTLVNSYASGSVEAGLVSPGNFAGGLIGRDDADSAVRACYSSGLVIVELADGGSGVGGLIGGASLGQAGLVIDVFSASQVELKADAAGYGQIVGHVESGAAGVISKAYYSGQVYDTGDGRYNPTGQAQAPESFFDAALPPQADWDFVATWCGRSHDHPVLCWQLR